MTHIYFGKSCGVHVHLKVISHKLVIYYTVLPLRWFKTVSYCVTKMITTCSPMIGQFFDTMIVASSDKEWFLTVGNCFAPP